MDQSQAQELLAADRTRVQELLADTVAAGREDRLAEAEPGDMEDPAQALGQQGVDDAVAASLRERLAAIERAEQRLRDGTYGVSTRSGAPIPDERLRADPTAELTVEEAASS